MCILYHLDRSRHSVDVCSHTYHVNNTVCSVNNICLVIASSDIRHNRYLHLCIILSDYTANGFFVTELPLSELFYIEHLLGSLVAEFHIINTSLQICFIKCFYKFICKIKIVDKSSISNCSIKHLNIRSVRDHISAYHRCFLLNLFYHLMSRSNSQGYPTLFLFIFSL